MTKKRVAVGMSGGVDSSVAALLLLEQGYDVFGVTLRVLPPLANAYDPEKDESVLRARAVAKKLGIEHYVAVCDDAFTDRVLKRCHDDFAGARTPNPCCYCNRYVKFGWMLDFALEHGADFLSTGHYVNVKEVGGVRRLFKGRDAAKDQSYFLFGVPDSAMARVITPLGDMGKPEVRAIAARHGFENASASDSQDICFDIYGDDYTNFLQERFGAMTRPGNFVTADGKIWNSHEGYHRYTVGQRKGLGVALGVPAFVQSVDPATGNVLVTADKSVINPSEPITFTVNVTNTGQRAGAEVVQLYVTARNSSVERVPKELKGFSKVYLEPGKTATVKITIGKDAVSYFDAGKHEWVAERGDYSALIGTSSDVLPKTVDFKY